MTLPKTPSEWKQALASLPSTPEKIPAFFFGHGSPMLAMSDNVGRGRGLGGSQDAVMQAQGPNGPLANFLRDFGPTLLKNYRPRAILVVSAHWESEGEQLVTDYGDENPLLMDYFGFQPSLYELKFKSRGDSALTRRVVQLLSEAGYPARSTPKKEARGQDGRGFSGPGLDHGVFVPFRIMFGEEFLEVPIVEMTLDGTLDPERNWALGQAVLKLREENVLVLSGGLTIHNLRDFSCFTESTARPIYKAFDKAVLDAVSINESDARRAALIALLKHEGFRHAHPRAEHFVPIYVAAGAGGDGEAKILSAVYGATTIAFGL